MKLLFDENLSPKLVDALAHEYPESTHVATVGMRGLTDHKIWDYCRLNGFAIVSKDTDFLERSIVEGLPPKVIWLDVGNAGTALIAELLRREQKRIETFETQEESALILSIPRSAR